MKELLFNKIVESGKPEFKIVMKYTNVMDVIEYGPGESGFMSQDDVEYILDDCQSDIEKAVCCDVDLVDGVAALVIEYDYAKVCEDNSINKNNNNVEEKVMNNKGTKVVVSMVNGEIKVNGMKGKEYNVVLDDSVAQTFEGYKNTIRELNVQLSSTVTERDGYKSRLDKAIAYFNENKQYLPKVNKVQANQNSGVKTNVNQTQINHGTAPVVVHVCEDCGREITAKAADYCEKNSAVFGGGVFCYSCQRKHARRAN
jgi:hypothetical protein